jgi:hypothetical protein
MVLNKCKYWILSQKLNHCGNPEPEKTLILKSKKRKMKCSKKSRCYTEKEKNINPSIIGDM